MAKRWYYKDENGNKVPVPQYKIDADDYYTKAMSDSRYYEKSATDTLLYDKVSKTDIVQSTGTSTTAVMSQKAVSDALSNVYTKSESDAMLADKQNVLIAGDGITIADDVISVAEEKFTVWSNPRIDEFVTTFENFGYNDDGTQKTSGSSTRSWVFRIGNYGHKKVFFNSMNAWMCDGLDDAQNMINPTLLGKSSGNVDITEEHIGKYVVAMSIGGNVLGSVYCLCVQFCDDKTQAELDADERMLSDMYAGNLMRYAVATSSISDTPTLEWGNGAELQKNVSRNIFLDIVSRPNIAYECNVARNLSYLYFGCGRLIEITPLWDTSLVKTMQCTFQMCRSLRYADLSHLDMGALTDVAYLFNSCVALQSVTLPPMPSMKKCGAMFSICTSLQSVTLPPMPSLVECGSMFRNCTSLQSVTLPPMPSLVECGSMFRNCTSLQSVTLPSLPSLVDCIGMFHSCTSLQSVTLPPMPSLVDCRIMFYSCSSLQSITLPSLPSAKKCASMFMLCSSLQSLRIDFPNCNDLSQLFYNCRALHTVEIVDIRNATNLENAFLLCSSLENITCVEELPKCAINFSWSSKLTLESVTNIITHLPDLSGIDSKTLTLNATTKALLTEALIAEATNKNWIIA